MTICTVVLIGDSIFVIVIEAMGDIELGGIRRNPTVGVVMFDGYIGVESYQSSDEFVVRIDVIHDMFLLVLLLPNVHCIVDFLFSILTIQGQNEVPCFTTWNLKVSSFLVIIICNFINQRTSREIDVINILYDCVLSNTPYKAGQEPSGRITQAPGLDVEKDREGL